MGTIEDLTRTAEVLNVPRDSVVFKYACELGALMQEYEAQHDEPVETLIMEKGIDAYQEEMLLLGSEAYRLTIEQISGG